MKLASSAATFSVVGEFSCYRCSLVASTGRTFTYHALFRYTLLDKRPQCRGWETPVTKWNGPSLNLEKNEKAAHFRALSRYFLLTEKYLFLFFMCELSLFTRVFVVCKFAFYFVSYFLWPRWIANEENWLSRKIWVKDRVKSSFCCKPNSWSINVRENVSPALLYDFINGDNHELSGVNMIFTRV